MGTASRQVLIQNDLGLHMRAAGALVRLAGRYACEITLERRGQRANAKSIMSVLSLAATRGTELVIRADGPDADQALDAVCALVAQGFEP